MKSSEIITKKIYFSLLISFCSACLLSAAIIWTASSYAHLDLRPSWNTIGILLFFFTFTALTFFGSEWVNITIKWPRWAKQLKNSLGTITIIMLLCLAIKNLTAKGTVQDAFLGIAIGVGLIGISNQFSLMKKQVETQLQNWPLWKKAAYYLAEGIIIITFMCVVMPSKQKVETPQAVAKIYFEPWSYSSFTKPSVPIWPQIKSGPAYMALINNEEKS